MESMFLLCHLMTEENTDRLLILYGKIIQIKVFAAANIWHKSISVCKICFISKTKNLENLSTPRYTGIRTGEINNLK